MAASCAIHGSRWRRPRDARKCLCATTPSGEARHRQPLPVDVNDGGRRVQQGGQRQRGAARRCVGDLAPVVEKARARTQKHATRRPRPTSWATRPVPSVARLHPAHTAAMSSLRTDAPGAHRARLAGAPGGAARPAQKSARRASASWMEAPDAPHCLMPGGAPLDAPPAMRQAHAASEALPTRSLASRPPATKRASAAHDVAGSRRPAGGPAREFAPGRRRPEIRGQGCP